jgi:hypothetical protein
MILESEDSEKRWGGVGRQTMAGPQGMIELFTSYERLATLRVDLKEQSKVANWLTVDLIGPQQKKVLLG